MSKRQIKIPKQGVKKKIDQQIEKGRQLVLSAQSKNENRDNFEIKYKQWVEFTGEILKEIFVSSTYAADFKEHRSSKVEYVNSGWIPDIEYYLTKQLNPKLHFLRVLNDNLNEFVEIKNEEKGNNVSQKLKKDVMTDDELELKILEKYIAKHKEAEIADPQTQNKCARELDMREILRDFEIYKEAELEYYADLWLTQLTSTVPGVLNKPLRRCSKSELSTSKHQYNSRAYIDPHQKIPRPAWERIRELQSKISKQLTETSGRELEQKFNDTKDHYVNPNRIQELSNIQNAQFDLTKLIRMCEELNICYSRGAILAVAMLVRAILDHVPPIFNQTSFNQVANNYGGAKSFKESMLNLGKSSRKIADSYLHIQIRSKEALPNKTQIDFRNDIDVLLQEIVRILK